MSYLRFTPLEYRTICELCLPLDLGDDFFRHFKAFLVTSLLHDLPDLANRIALLRKDRLRILFDHLQSRKTKTRNHLTTQEFRDLAEACRSVVTAHRFLHLARNTLVRHFHEIKPILARKLARMDLQQFQELYLRAKEEKRKG